MFNRKQMTEQYLAFEKLWNEIESRNVFPETAVKNLPTALSRDTKNRLGQLNADDAIKVIADAVREVDAGSVKPMDQLISERL